MFKATLFLAAGCVIHAVHSNEMDAMGNLRKHQKITHIAFLIACLAIAGIPIFSGFFSKDEILVAAHEASPVIYWCQTIVAGLTAFYMFRLYYRIFWYNEPDYGHHTPHESPANMWIPLVVLTVYTCTSGFFPFTEYITPDLIGFESHIHWNIAIPSVIVALIGIGVATFMYKKKTEYPDKVVACIKNTYHYAYNKFYIDEIYLFITHKIIYKCICDPIAWFDRHIIDGFMNLLSWITNKSSLEIKSIQSGNVQQYAWVFILGVLAIVTLTIYL